ncbi:hypothetical protein D6829_02345 [Candidatus Pacearchaeota archaeon]|nr:MAG: hypothetical protein D6829_02345 [Candidatus Pacearchaeota archaeon]
MGDAKDLSDYIMAVSPWMNASGSEKDKEAMFELVRQHGIIEALKKAKEEGISLSPSPVSSHKLRIQSEQNQIEPIYYWVLDFLTDAGWDVKKVVDNFMASPGSGQFADMSQRLTRLQEEGMKIFGTINTVIKSILNILYDLKEFEVRLSHYDDANSSDPERRKEGLLALKQIWLDNVDIKKGRGAIHMMANELGFMTIRDAFMISNSVEDLKRLNSDEGEAIINDQVLRILIPRLNEFLKWKEYSEKELRKRFNVEKAYLKSQVETLKLYTSWVKPYLRNAQKLRQKGFDNHAALVNAFSTTMFELVLLCKKKEKLPWQFEGYKLKKDYFAVIVASLSYRGHLGQKETQRGSYAFVFGGLAEINLEAYALNAHEIKLIEEAISEEDMVDILRFSDETTIESLEAIKEDLDHFLKDDGKKEEKKKKEKENIDPFTALLGLFKPKRKKNKSKKFEGPMDLEKDNFIEKTVRANAAKNASDGIFSVYDIYKKAHGMASAQNDFVNVDESRTKPPEVSLKGAFRSWEKA